MSQMSLEDMLRELELLPVWQQRQPLPALSSLEAPLTDAGGIAVPAPESSLTEPSVIEVAAAKNSAEESAAQASFKAEVAMPDVMLSAQVQYAESVETATSAGAPLVAAEQIQPLRLLLSEDGRYAFLIEPNDAQADTQAVETLLNNMLRAMRMVCRVDVTDVADMLFTEHTPKMIVSMGVGPANQLLGKTHTVDDWRRMQQQTPLAYGGVPLIVTYHPAHLLQNTAEKVHAWHDLCAAMKLMQDL